MGVLRRILEPSGYITTRLNVQIFDILPTECLYVFSVISEQKLLFRSTVLTE